MLQNILSANLPPLTGQIRGLIRICTSVFNNLCVNSDNGGAAFVNGGAKIPGQSFAALARHQARGDGHGLREGLAILQNFAGKNGHRHAALRGDVAIHGRERAGQEGAKIRVVKPGEGDVLRTRRPASAMARYAPSAMVSYPATTAVGGVLSASKRFIPS